jgi:hypothetical protein
MWLRLIELLAAAGLLWLFVFQVFLPVIAGHRIFPMFRREGKVQKKISDVIHDKYVADLEAKLNEVKGEKKNDER